MRKIYTISGVLLFILLAKSVFGTSVTNVTLLPQEYWISTNTDSQDLGTLDNPYICDTQIHFDSTMNSLPQNCTVHILAGTYQTMGSGSAYLSSTNGYALKSEQKILGSGIDVTIIQLVSNAVNFANVMADTAGTNEEVSDLTLDANYVPGVSGNVTYKGLNLNGPGMAIRRVKAINLASFAPITGPNPESFGIGIGCFGNGLADNGEDAVIEDCEVSHFQGGSAASAIYFNGSANNWMSGVIRGNHVFLNSTHANLVAFNGSYMCNTLIEGNYVSGASTGFYGDTGTYTNIIVSHNTFNNCTYAVQLSNYPRQNITFCYNTILLATNAGGSFGFWFVSNSIPPVCFTNIAIVENNIGFDGQPNSISGFFNAQTIAGLLIADNRIDSNLTNNNTFSGCTGINIHNNYDLNGKLLTNLNQVLSPNGIARRVITTTNYNASYADEYIGIQATNHIKKIVYLPSASGYAGKEYVVVDEVGNAATYSINLVPPSPTKINGATNLLINANYGASTITSDGANWFAH